MKKIFLVIALLCISVSLVSAQGFYVKAGAGYSFGAGKSTGEFGYDEDGNTTTDKPFSLGKGINTAIGAGYMFNEYIGAELAVGYTIGLDNTFTDESSGTAVSYKFTTKIKSSGLTVTPALKLVAPIGDKFSVYSRLGIVIPVMGKAILTIDEKETYSSETTTSFTKMETTSYFRLGGAAAMGVSFALTDKLNLFAEVNGIWSSFQLKKATVTEATIDGKDILPFYTTREKEIEFQKEYNSSNDTHDENKPAQEATRTFPASSIGLTIGISFKF